MSLNVKSRSRKCEKSRKKCLTSRKWNVIINELMHEKQMFQMQNKNKLKKLLTNMKHFDII